MQVQRKEYILIRFENGRIKKSFSSFDEKNALIKIDLEYISKFINFFKLILKKQLTLNYYEPEILEEKTMLEKALNDNITNREFFMTGFIENPIVHHLLEITNTLVEAYFNIVIKSNIITNFDFKFNCNINDKLKEFIINNVILLDYKINNYYNRFNINILNSLYFNYHGQTIHVKFGNHEESGNLLDEFSSGEPLNNFIREFYDINIDNDIVYEDKEDKKDIIILDDEFDNDALAEMFYSKKSYYLEYFGFLTYYNQHVIFNNKLYYLCYNAESNCMFIKFNFDNNFDFVLFLAKVCKYEIKKIKIDNNLIIINDIVY